MFDCPQGLFVQICVKFDVFLMMGKYGPCSQLDQPHGENVYAQVRLGTRPVLFKRYPVPSAECFWRGGLAGRRGWGGGNLQTCLCTSLCGLERSQL